jgi:Spy/CpxP family protein refolding chaperone
VSHQIKQKTAAIMPQICHCPNTTTHAEGEATRPSSTHRILGVMTVGQLVHGGRRGAALAAAALLVASVVAPVAAQTPWWRTERVQRALALSPQQVDAIEAVFRTNLAERRARWRALERAEGELQGAIDRGDETTAVALISTVEDLRRTINVARTRMLLEMLELLSPQQRRNFATATGRTRR